MATYSTHLLRITNRASELSVRYQCHDIKPPLLLLALYEDRQCDASVMLRERIAAVDMGRALLNVWNMTPSGLSTSSTAKQSLARSSNDNFMIALHKLVIRLVAAQSPLFTCFWRRCISLSCVRPLKLLV
ncbi:MAG: hypothetical protein IPL73_06285 [Candidatus Obscuribacter sp.]|nr:hypothetical protein [Candidatus Obscuribacter sp.]